MKRLLSLLAIASLLATTATERALAQRTVAVGLGGGTSIPVGRLADRYAAGGNGLVMILLGSPESSLGVRVDGSYNSFRGRTVAGAQIPDSHISAVTGNIVLAPFSGLVKPYFLVGGGYYRIRDVELDRRVGRFGLNAGAGISYRMGPISAFTELRFHRVYQGPTGQRFLPVDIGIVL